MGGFDLDNLLSELGLDRSQAEKEADAPNQSEETRPTDSESMDQPVENDPEPVNESPEINEEPFIESEQFDESSDSTDPHSSQETESPTDSKPKSGIKALIRNNPKETPRPPDLSGRGLKHENNSKDQPSKGKQSESSTVCPTDGLSMLWERPESESNEPELGHLLLERGVIRADQLNSAQRVHKQTPGRSLTHILLETGVDEEALLRVLAEYHHLPFETIDPNEGYHQASMTRLGMDFCKENKLLPLRREKNRIVIGSPNPGDVFLLDEVRRRLGGRSIKHVLITSQDIALVLDLLAEDESDDFAFDELLADIEEDDITTIDRNRENDQEGDENLADQGPVIRYANYIIQTALKEGASDIHIEPGDKSLKVRFRIDGVLVDVMKPPHQMHAALVSRLKIMANLDIAERRLPQDGRIQALVNGRNLDLRVSTLPTVMGEKCVMRILDTRSISVGLDQLGFSPETLFLWRRQVTAPHGIILVTGPTGSGKTTTLYSSLKELDTQRMNISTVEEPVEYHLDGISQVQIHERIGMTFAKVLKSLLRQDPDVVMVGEIRDLETARIAIQASLTGHLVLSTLHTNDAPSSVTRLINIGVEPFLVGAALNAILAQRLVRRVCSGCSEEQEQSEDLAEFLMMQGLAGTTVYSGSGCDKCRQTGYSGRVGLYELLVFDDVVRDAVAGNPSVSEFRRMAVERGMITLRQDGIAKVADGMTTIEEVLRVTEATI